MGSFFHIIWNCPLIQEYWAEVVGCINSVIGDNREVTPKWCLLNTWTPTDAPRSQRLWATLGAMVAKRNIAKLWGSNLTPKLEDWKNDKDWNGISERAVYSSRGCPQKWSKVWGKWSEYRGHGSAPSVLDN